MRGSPGYIALHLHELDPEKVYEVREVRKRRSLTQNAYYWSLLGKLAAKLGMPDSEVHLDMLREWGSSECFELSFEVEPVDWFRYFDVLYETPTGRVVRAYKGSSEMDTAEFTRLLAGMREECEAQGIDVLTPQEIAALRR